MKNGKTLVLDLDETLTCAQQNPKDLQIYSEPELFRIFHPSNQKQICYSLEVLSNGFPLRIWGILRPGVEEFLRFAQEYFENVIIWSAGLPTYVEGICREIFQKSKLQMPRIIWNRNHCSTQNGYFHKPLKDLLKGLQDSQIQIDLRKTLILDDRDYTFFQNPENGVLIPPFKPLTILEMIDRSDESLFQFMNWLQRPEVYSSDDYRTLEKRDIFRKL